MTTQTDRRQYTSDLTDAQWELVRPFIETAQHMGRPREVDLREVTNAVLYLLSAADWLPVAEHSA